MSERTFAADAARGLQVVMAWGADIPARVAMRGNDLAQGLIFDLGRVEILAATYGVVPLVINDQGRPAVQTIGAAASRIGTAPDYVRLTYTAVHRLTRRIHQTAAYAARGVSMLQLPSVGLPDGGVPLPNKASVGDIGANPWIVVAAVVGVAAVVAAAWYASETESKRIEVEARSVQLHSQITAISDYLTRAKAMGQTPDPQVLDAIRSMGAETAGGPTAGEYGWILPAATGVAGGVLGLTSGLLGGWAVRGDLSREARR